MSDWKPLCYEYRGAIPNKVWMTNGKENALFKPDTEQKESVIEYEAYRIAKALGISCAKTEGIKLFDTTGVLSYNIETEPKIIYCHASTVYIKPCYLADDGDDSLENVINRMGKISMETVKNIPSIESGVVNMLFLDCLMSNRDRHGFNWKIMMNMDAEIVGLAPLFDHGMSLWNNFSPDYDYCMVPWAIGQTELKHYEMFQKLAADYPEQIESLMSKCANIELNDFSARRYNEMSGILQSF